MIVFIKSRISIKWLIKYNDYDWNINITKLLARINELIYLQPSQNVLHVFNNSYLLLQ